MEKKTARRARPQPASAEVPATVPPPPEAPATIPPPPEAPATVPPPPEAPVDDSTVAPPPPTDEAKAPEKQPKKKRRTKDAGNGETTTKRRKRAPGPNGKRPLNAYMFFFQDKMQDSHFKEMKVTETAREIAALWSQLGDDDKQPYNTKAAEAKAEYNARVAANA